MGPVKEVEEEVIVGKQCHPFVIKVFILFMLFSMISTCFPRQSFAYRYQDPLAQHDFILVGVGVLRQNLSNIDGDEISFNESEEGLPSGYSNRSYLFLNGEGVLFNDINFKLKASYDEEDPTETSKFLLHANRKKDYLVLGDHEHGTFQDTIFTSMDNYVRGLTLHGENDRLAATVMAGALRGEFQVDELRGNGTSGPYRLEEPPVLNGTETVKIETRDRLNVKRILKSTIAVRGKDYSINYDDGEITFFQPVDEQDFRGNPIYIIVTYQFDSPDGSWQQATSGTRLTFSPTDNIQIGATYLSSMPWEDNFSSENWDQRNQIYGSDIVYKLGDKYSISTEIARSETPSQGSGSIADGLRFRLDATPVNRFHVTGRYWRVDQKFLAFGNRDLASSSFSDDVAIDQGFQFRSAYLDLNLDPNINSSLTTDQEELGLSCKYDLTPFRSISAGYRRSRNNIEDDPYMPVDTEQNYFTAIKSIHPESTQWLLGIERTESFDDLDQTENDRVDHRIIGAVRQPLGHYQWTGPVFSQFAYQFEDINDRVAPENSLQIHDFFGRVEVLPVPKVLIYGEQGFQWLYEPNQDEFTNRQDTTMLGMDGFINRFFEIDASVRFKRDNSLISNEKESTEEIYTLRWQSHPFKDVRFHLRTEYCLSEDFISGRENKRNISEGHLYWDIHTNFLTQVKYTYETNTTDIQGSDRDETSSDILNLRLDYRLADQFKLYAIYRLENDKIISGPIPGTNSQTITVLLGTYYKFNNRFDLTASYRQKMLSDVVEDDRLKYFVELGYQPYRHLKIALGAEHFRYTTENEEGFYDADVAYLSLIFKL